MAEILNPSKEQIEAYRKAFRDEVIRMNNEEAENPFTTEELEISLNKMNEESAIFYMQHGVPAESVAYVQFM